MENGYGDHLSIDRVNVNANYETANCKWITKREQCRNKRSTIYAEKDGERKPRIKWAEFMEFPTTLLLKGGTRELGIMTLYAHPGRGDVYARPSRNIADLLRANNTK